MCIHQYDVVFLLLSVRFTHLTILNQEKLQPNDFRRASASPYDGILKLVISLISYKGRSSTIYFGFL